MALYVQPAAPPQLPTEGFKTLKELTRDLVFACNEKAIEFHVTKLTERSLDEVYNDLINFNTAFTALFQYTSEIMRYKKGTVEVTSKGKKKHINEWCDVADNWIDFYGYNNDINEMEMEELSKEIFIRFGHGIAIYNAYLACLIKAELFEV